ncbi:MAG: tryptophan synthase subunit alpha, partial [Duodenibacillus sp.]
MTQPNSCSCAAPSTGRFARLFQRLAAQKEGAFVPFVNLCDPTPEASLEILETLAANGADAFELGIPFSDPVADG